MCSSPMTDIVLAAPIELIESGTPPAPEHDFTSLPVIWLGHCRGE